MHHTTMLGLCSKNSMMLDSTFATFSKVSFQTLTVLDTYEMHYSSVCIDTPSITSMLAKLCDLLPHLWDGLFHSLINNVSAGWHHHAKLLCETYTVSQGMVLRTLQISSCPLFYVCLSKIPCLCWLPWIYFIFCSFWLISVLCYIWLLQLKCSISC